MCGFSGFRRPETIRTVFGFRVRIVNLYLERVNNAPGGGFITRAPHFRKLNVNLQLCRTRGKFQLFLGFVGSCDSGKRGKGPLVVGAACKVEDGDRDESSGFEMKFHLFIAAGKESGGISRITEKEVFLECGNVLYDGWLLALPTIEHRAGTDIPLDCVEVVSVDVFLSLAIKGVGIECCGAGGV